MGGVLERLHLGIADPRVPRRAARRERAQPGAGALALAKAGSAALVDAVNELNDQQNKSANAILKQFNAGERRSSSPAQSPAQPVAGQLGGPAATGPAQRRSGAGRRSMRTRPSTTRRRSKRTRSSAAYSGVFNPTAINSQIIQTAGPPKATGSNRRSTLEAGVLIGLVAGGLLGLGLAVWIDLRARQGAMTGAPPTPAAPALREPVVDRPAVREHLPAATWLLSFAIAAEIFSGNWGNPRRPRRARPGPPRARPRWPSSSVGCARSPIARCASGRSTSCSCSPPPSPPRRRSPPTRSTCRAPGSRCWTASGSSPSSCSAWRRWCSVRPANGDSSSAC